MKRIHSKRIGSLLQNEEFDDWWESESIQIPFLCNKELRITFMEFDPEYDKEFINEADNALQSFLAMNSAAKLELSGLVYENCFNFLTSVEHDEVHKLLGLMENRNEIWKYVYPQEIHITRRHRRDKNIYLSIVCECEWEQEHGLQLVFRKGKQLTRISSQDGHITEADAYDRSDEKDELLSKYSE